MTLLRFIISSIYFVIGVTGCGAFFWLGNYPAAVLAMVTGVINLILSYIHFLNYENKLLEWYSPQHLRQISRFGFYTFALSTSVLVYFTVVEIMLLKPILPIEDSAVIPIIWSFITGKSGLILFYYATSYSDLGERPLIEEPVEEEPQIQEITP